MSLLVAITGGEMLVDERDAVVALSHRWKVDHNGYAIRNRGPGQRALLFHRVICEAAAGEEVDHANGNPLDNRRSNLRLCTRAENARNTRPLSSRKHGQPFKGISPSGKRWRALIHVGHRQVYLGTFSTSAAAAMAYDAAAHDAFGEFARPNFSGEGA